MNEHSDKLLRSKHHLHFQLSYRCLQSDNSEQPISKILNLSNDAKPPHQECSFYIFKPDDPRATSPANTDITPQPTSIIQYSLQPMPNDFSTVCLLLSAPIQSFLLPYLLPRRRCPRSHSHRAPTSIPQLKKYNNPTIPVSKPSIKPCPSTSPLSHTQPSSPPLRLPSELLSQILSNLIAGRTFKPIYLPSEKPMLLDGTQEPVPWYTRPNPLDLPRTCRQVYVEGVGIFYGSNTFVVNDPQILLDYHDRFIPHRRLQAMGKLDFGFVNVNTRVGKGCMLFSF
jgi:hypothetical protein